MYTHWPGLLLTIALLLGVGVCFKRFDFLLINEVKALISVIFGFGTSCLLLGFIWLIQKKPTHSIWPMPANGTSETPSMHPNGSLSSYGSIDEQMHIHTISSSVDKPPNYEDALINSKPVSWTYLNSKKDNHSLESPNHNTTSHQISSSSSNSSVQQTVKNTNQRSITTYTAATTSNSMAQLALSIVRGFTTLEAAGLHQPVALARSQHDYNNQILDDAPHLRKLSYCQLDVGQLITMGSPPKYHELTLDEHPEVLSNNSNEHSAGDSNRFNPII